MTTHWTVRPLAPGDVDDLAAAAALRAVDTLAWERVIDEVNPAIIAPDVEDALRAGMAMGVAAVLEEVRRRHLLLGRLIPRVTDDA